MSGNPGTTPQGNVPATGIGTSQDYPRLVFSSPYFETIAIAEIIEPSVLEAVEGILPALVPPYVDGAVQAGVQQYAVLLTGSTMTGPLLLNPLMPTADSMAATKAYVDAMVATAGVPEVPPVPQGQTWARQTGQWVPIDPSGGTFLPISGGTMQGNINMSGNTITNMAAVPAMPNGAAPAQWVLNQIAAVSLYQGTWNADTNVPDLTQLATHVNGYTWFALTANPAGIVITPAIPGLQGKTVFNGDTIIYSTVQGGFNAIHAGGLTLAEADGRYVQLAGSQMSGALLLHANASQPLEAVTLQQLQAFVPPGAVPEAPADGQAYARVGLSHTWSPAVLTAGGVMTGLLTLSGNASAQLNPVPLQQMTSAITAAQAGTVQIAGSTMTGPLVLSGNAGTALNPVPLQQLTTMLTNYLALSGGTLTGGLTLAADPTTNLGAATKQYADTAAGKNVGRNLADNALFNIQQRGFGPFTAIGYTLDRYMVAFQGGTASVTSAPLSDAQRAQIGDESAIVYLQNTFTGTSGAGDYISVLQKLESARRLSGKMVTVSFWAAANSALNLGVSIDQNFGTGGSPSAPVNLNGQAVAISTTFARYQATFNIPSTAGKTFGTSGGDYTQINFWYSTGATNAPRSGIGVQSGTIQLWGVQVEIGSSATPLEKLPPQMDLARCQRFFVAMPSNSIIGGYTPVSGGIISYTPITLPVTMRASPTVVMGTPSYVNASGFQPWNVSSTIVSLQTTSSAIGAFSAFGPFTASADL